MHQLQLTAARPLCCSYVHDVMADASGASEYVRLIGLLPCRGAGHVKLSVEVSPVGFAMQAAH